MSLERRKFFVDLRKKKKALFLKLGNNFFFFFLTVEENLNVSIPNGHNKAEGRKLFFQHVLGCHLFHRGAYHYVTGIFYLNKQSIYFDMFLSYQLGKMKSKD